MTDPRRLAFPPLKVTPRVPVRITLRNGLVAHLLEDHALPVVRFVALARAGSVFDPPARAGLASLTGGAMRLGGTRALPGDALDEELDLLGAEVDAASDEDSGSLRAWTLARHFPRVLELFAGLLRDPAFPAEKVELARAHDLELIQRRWDQPSATASIMFRQVLYGADSPWGRLSTPATVGAVTRDEVVALQRAIWRPDGLLLAAAGDFRIADVAADLERLFGDWPAPAGPRAEFPASPAASPAGVFLVPREVGQANFRMGHLAIRQGHPDYYALRLMDMILGNGTFNSRLFRDIRTKRGLAYSIWSRLAARPFATGTFAVGGETKYETCDVAFAAVRQHLTDLATREVSESEIKLAKEQLDHSLAFEFQSAWEVARRQAVYEYQGLPADWLLRERERILAVTRRQIRDAAARHLKPKALALVVVGDPAQVEARLARVGPVTRLPVPER